MKVLISAYACAPGEGSEPGVGWNWALQAAQVAEVWVLTRAKNRPAIERQLARHSVPNLHFVYHDLPNWATFWKRGSKGIHLYYYLWQVSAVPKLRRLHKQLGFDLGHHVTFVTFRFPSALAFLGIPFVWGPIAGAERIPWAFYRTLGLPGVIHEVAHEIHNGLVRLDPFVRHTARQAVTILAVNEATRNAIPGKVQNKCQLVPAIGIDHEQVSRDGVSDATGELRLLFVGALVPRKGLRLALEALAQLDPSQGRVSLTVVGDGPDRAKLELLASRLGISDRVKFIGQRTRSEVLRIYPDHHALVFPSLRDSGGFVVLEAMAAGLPIVCLTLGGAATAVTNETGFRIQAHTPRQVVKDLASAIACLRDNPELCRRMGEAAQRRVAQSFSWREKSLLLHDLYASVSS